jgi:hypothetical protein
MCVLYVGVGFLALFLAVILSVHPLVNQTNVRFVPPNSLLLGVTCVRPSVRPSVKNNGPEFPSVFFFSKNPEERKKQKKRRTEETWYVGFVHSPRNLPADSAASLSLWGDFDSLASSADSASAAVFCFCCCCSRCSRCSRFRFFSSASE